MLKLKSSHLCIGTSQAKGKCRKKKALNPCTYVLLYNPVERQFEILKKGKNWRKYWSLDKKRTAINQVSFCSISMHFPIANDC